MQSSLDSLKSLIHLLDLPDTDYWSDDASCVARAIIWRGGNELLQEIMSELESWSIHRQQHLAYILGDSQATLELEIALLTKLASSDDAEVAYTARESLGNARASMPN